ncbi:MAG: hypothetical protein IJM35_05035 [Bacteroidales bacterium]|nr:hypothetical protein [Bacteroidales bacterium]
MMRRISMLAVLGLVAVAACVKETVLTEPEGQTITSPTFTATTEPATKTALSGNDEQGYEVNWQNGDQIMIFGAQSTYGVFTTESTTSSGNFTLTSGSGPKNPDYRAFYPATLPRNNSYMSLQFPATQQYVAGNVAQAPMYAYSSTTNLDFKNLCGIIRLNLSTTQSGITVSKIILTADQPMSGYFSINNNTATITSSTAAGVTLDCGSGVAIGSEPTPFYLSVPQRDYTNLRIKVVTTDGARQSKVANKTISVTRSKITPITLSFNNINSDAIDLSANGTANSYIVSTADSYKFRGTIKGNGMADLSGISATTPSVASAALLWATFGTDTAPASNELIQNVRYNSSDGYVYFDTGETFKEGNALIAVRDASNNILWSWHIWFESDNLNQLAQTYPTSNAVMMDRNLGATRTEYSQYNFLDAGLLYEWGRKDPFPNKARIHLNGSPTFVDAGIRGQAITLGSLDIAGTAAHPTMISSGGISGATWDSDEKTIFDPCPPGWKVPAPSVFSGVTNTATWTSGQGGTINLGNATAWFPAAGTYGHGHLQHFYQGEGAYMYTTTSSYSRSFDITSSIHGSMQAKDSYWACSVRCVRDDVGSSDIDISVYQDLSTGGTANCYQVQKTGTGASFCKYKFPATVKGNGAADLAGISKDTDPNSIFKAELLWASYGTSTAPAADALIKDVFYKDGYVCFTVNRNGSRIYEGNAVIAIRDYFGNIIWSWHIWLEEDYLTSGHDYTGGGTFMNRNLGASHNQVQTNPSDVPAADYGLLYQWGRKDPFLSAPDRTTYSATEPAVYGATITAKNQLYTMAETIQHPTDFPFTYNNTPWMVDGEKDIAFWDGAKTIFDPCPPGWKVPSKSSFGTTFMSNFSNLGTTTDGVYVNCGSANTWYPSVAYRQGAPTKNGSSVYIQGQGILQHRGDNPYIRVWCSDGILWRDSLKPNDSASGNNFAGGNFAGLYDYDQDLLVSPWFYYGTYRDNACSVRCVKE